MVTANRSRRGGLLPATRAREVVSEAARQNRNIAKRSVSPENQEDPLAEDDASFRDPRSHNFFPSILSINTLWNTMGEITSHGFEERRGPRSPLPTTPGHRCREVRERMPKTKRLFRRSFLYEFLGAPGSLFPGSAVAESFARRRTDEVDGEEEQQPEESSAVNI